MCENKVLKLLDVFLLLAVGLLMVIERASYSWLTGCDLYSKASALEQIVPMRYESIEIAALFWLLKAAPLHV